MQSGAHWHYLDIAIAAIDAIVASEVTSGCTFEAIDAIATSYAHIGTLVGALVTSCSALI